MIRNVLYYIYMSAITPIFIMIGIFNMIAGTWGWAIVSWVLTLLSILTLVWAIWIDNQRYKSELAHAEFMGYTDGTKDGMDAMNAVHNHEPDDFIDKLNARYEKATVPFKTFPWSKPVVY